MTKPLAEMLVEVKSMWPNSVAKPLANMFPKVKSLLWMTPDHQAECDGEALMKSFVEVDTRAP